MTLAKDPQPTAAPDPPDRQVAAWALGEVRRIVLAGLVPSRAAVYLFGSWAKGTPTRLSDIDVAVLPGEPLPPGALARIRELLDESRVPYRVDLVDLTDCDEDFRARVTQEGIAWSA